MTRSLPAWTAAPASHVRSALQDWARQYDQHPGIPPDAKTLFAPAAHGIALGFDRPLVVGGRGTGKSYLATAVCNDSARQKLVTSYPAARLGEVRCFLGFFGRLGLVGAPFTPTAGEMTDLLAHGVAPDHIWRAVLCRFLGGRSSDSLEEVYRAGKTRDAEFRRQLDTSTGSRVLMVCDALDRLAPDWERVRMLARGVLQLALDLRGFKGVNVKVFMRRDQFEDDALFDFADASKLRTGAVDLDWEHDELYGMLFNWLESEVPPEDWNRHFAPLMPRMPPPPEGYRPAFEHLAGEYMGYRKRGFTYTWVPKHLADTTHQASPRSFMVAMGRAANAADERTTRPIDHRGIYEGVRAASRVRVDELREDHPWIRVALDDLSGLVVPCPPRSFISQWRTRRTATRIRESTWQGISGDVPPDPISLASGASVSDEQALLDALVTLRVAEVREATGKVNLPDVYRVAAKIGRRGGVAPLARSG